MIKKKLLTLIVLFLLLSQTSCQKTKVEPKAKDPADELIEKMNVAVNDDLLKNVKSVSMKIIMTVPFANLTGNSEVFSIENKSYMKVSMAGMEQEVGYDGKKAWGKDIVQGLRELSGQERESIIQATVKVLKDPKSYFTKISLSPDENFQEKACFVLVYKKTGISDRKVFVDKTTYLTAGSIETQDTPQGKMTVKTIINSYKKLSNGYLMADKVVQDMGIMKVTLSFTEIKFDAVIDEKIFNQPEN
jgi:hypothetical protein